jgi:hypothetical protein
MLVYSRVSSALQEGLQGYKDRGKLYEFAEHFVREVQGSKEIYVSNGIDIIAQISGETSRYSVIRDDESQYLSFNEDRVLRVNGAWFSFAGRLAAATLELPNSSEINLYGWRRIASD